ncbi:Zinc finger CCCH domain-containing protein [Rhynchospora pubera]|uniref:Zinc finger CCCH domain-containing protein n=1 Tax=Rhynchospora pubera TaxID=906938 RepID=A0AAV8HHZ9_9POAL|nr:Zinc finger CCCH domain-containing protein [Rhynchospora pubera]
MTNLTIETDDSLATPLELAANDDLLGFKRCIERDLASADEPGPWYSRRKVLEERTPLMVAATYGSLDVLSLLISLPGIDVNRRCGSDETTALHCAASGGSSSAAEAVKLLLSVGADINALDLAGRRPAEVIAVPPKLFDVKASLEELLGACPKIGSPSSPMTMTKNFMADRVGSEKKEYPIDPSLPDIKNSIYASDEFRMYSFKIRPCSRAYSHDWTECPFVHPGENARRRDPRKFHYSCVPCPDFRKGSCRRGDMCEYAHGVFECWLHPAQYRTRLCKDGTACNRRVCFFAHTHEELRPLYVSTGSAVPGSTVASPRAEMAGINLMPPGSPSFTPPMSPTANGWAQGNVPTLHLPGSSIQLSRLRSSLSARDMPVGEFAMMQHPDFDPQLINDMCYSTRLSASGGSRSAWGKNLNLSNLEDLFSAEMNSSPRFSNSEQGNIFSPSHQAAILNQFQQQQQSILSPINTGPTTHPSILQASLGIQSPGRMSPRAGMDPGSPINSHLSALAQREKQTIRSLSSRELGSNISRLLGSTVGSPVNGSHTSWGNWGSPSGSGRGAGSIDWGVNGEELGKLRRSSSFEMRSSGEEPDLSWVNSLVREAPSDRPTVTCASTGTGNAADLNEAMNGLENDQEAVLGAYIEQMKLDQAVA